MCLYCVCMCVRLLLTSHCGAQASLQCEGDQAIIINVPQKAASYFYLLVLFIIIFDLQISEFNEYIKIFYYIIMCIIFKYAEFNTFRDMYKWLIIFLSFQRQAIISYLHFVLTSLYNPSYRYLLHKRASFNFKLFFQRELKTSRKMFLQVSSHNLN